MAASAMSVNRTMDRESALELVREVVRVEAETLLNLDLDLDIAIYNAARLIAECSGVVHVAGMGKAGLVGQKFTATMASFGIRAFFLHPAEAVHGDLGRIRQNDLLFAFSQSGETEEIIRIIKPVRRIGCKIVALTENEKSPLGAISDKTIAFGKITEACPLRLAPTTSTTVMMVIGDALAILASQLQGFKAQDFAANHPAGKLGRKLAGVDQIMRTGRHVRVASRDEIVRDVLIRLGGARRRSGAILVVSKETGVLEGIFTDSDLVRLLERGRAAMLDQPIAVSMTTKPSFIDINSTVADAIDSLRARKLSELPVLNEAGQPVGLIDVTDLIGLVPMDLEEDQV